MNISTFLKSARVLSSWFPRFVEIGYRDVHIPACDFLPRVRPAGVLCENEMLEATKGVNTHKGAIFSLVLLCSAAGRLLANGIALTRGGICMEVASICEYLVSRELGDNKAAATAGERLFHLYGMTGARGEAASGYRTVRSVALPVYDRLQANGVGDEMALLQVLLHLLAFNTDTNLVSRGLIMSANTPASCYSTEASSRPPALRRWPRLMTIWSHAISAQAVVQICSRWLSF